MCMWHSIPWTLDLVRWSHRYGRDHTEALPVTQEMRGWQWGGQHGPLLLLCTLSGCSSKAVANFIPYTRGLKSSCSPHQPQGFSRGEKPVFANKFLTTTPRENGARSKRLKAHAEFIQLVCRAGRNVSLV